VTIRVDPWIWRSDSISNLSEVRSTTTDPDLANNRDEVETTVFPRPTGPMIPRPERAAQACHAYPEKSWIPMEGGGYLITGTPENDKIWLRGSRADDIICALAGGDEFSDWPGDDVIFGHEGRDRIKGGDGADYISGGQGSDELWGRDGNDELKGNDGDDYLTGHSGQDTVSGGGGDDNVGGDTGADLLYGGAGRDKIAGGQHGDELYGDAGSDSLRGETGHDKIYARDGVPDYVNCGEGTRDLAVLDRREDGSPDGCETSRYP
jgi:hypothetical protein